MSSHLCNLLADSNKKSPSPGLTLRSESRDNLFSLPSRKEEDQRSRGFRGWVTHYALCSKHKELNLPRIAFYEATLSPLYRKGVWGIGNINVGGKIVSVARLNLRHEPAALLCRFDWLHLGIVHTKYALCSRFAQSLPRIDTLSFSEELLTSNNKSPSQEGDLGGG